MTHTWYIKNLKRQVSDGMVTEVDYECKTLYNLEGQQHPVGQNYYGQLTLTTGSVSDPDFITYENLTESTVFGWVSSNIDTASIQTQNSASIAERVQIYQNLAQQESQSEGLPW